MKKLHPLYEPPWKIVLLRYLKKYESRMPLSSEEARPTLVTQVYRAMKWSPGQAYWKTRFGRGHETGARQPRELRPTELAMMAHALKLKNPGEFMYAVAVETGIPEPAPFDSLGNTARARIDKAIAKQHPIVHKQTRREFTRKLRTSHAKRKLRDRHA